MDPPGPLLRVTAMAMYEISDLKLNEIRKSAGPRADYIIRVLNQCKVEEKPQRKVKKADE